jgi:hypothetical protein
VKAVQGVEEREVAIMTATMMRLEGRPDLAD